MMKRILTLSFCGCLLLAGCGKPAGDAAGSVAADATPELGESTDSIELGESVGAVELGEATEVSEASTAADGPLSLTAENTKIEFIGKHTDDKPDRVGTFGQLSGTIDVAPEGEDLKSISIEIQTDSLETEFPMLTTHLKSPDFLEVREYPTITFESTGITAGDDDEYTVTGKLSLHGTEKEISFPATVTHGDGGLELSSQFVIDRTDYGINFGLEGVQKEVSITVTVGSDG